MATQDDYIRTALRPKTCMRRYTNKQRRTIEHSTPRSFSVPENSFIYENDSGLWGHFVTMIHGNLSQHGAQIKIKSCAACPASIDGLLFFLQNPLAPQPEDAVDALFSTMTKKPKE